MPEAAKSPLPWRDLSTFLSALRWISAWLVVLAHLRNEWFVHPSAVQAHSLVVDAFYWVSGFGHAAVMTFFVLSGYLVGGRALDVQRSGQGHARYVADRLTRLYVVLLPALGISFLLVWWGTQLSGNPVLLAHASNSMTTLAGNVFFLQTILVFPFALNWPLWSLANEFWYYLLTPILLWSVLAKPIWIRLLGVAAVAALLVFVGKEIASYWVVWLLGMCVRLGWIPKFDRWFALVLWAVVVAAVRTLHEAPSLPLDILQGLALAFVIASFEGAKAGSVRPGRGVHHALADWSFSLYVLHSPLILFATIVVSGNPGNLQLQLEPFAFIQFVWIMAMLLGLAWLFAFVTEFRTVAIRTFIYARLGWHRRPPDPPPQSPTAERAD